MTDSPRIGGTRRKAAPGRRELTEVVRHLIGSAVTTEASESELAEVTALLCEAAQRLDRAQPVESNVVSVPDEGESSWGDRTTAVTEIPGTLAGAMPFDVIVGPCSPLALPVEIEFDPPRALGHATYTEAFEGAPGWVHGAVVAGAFDVILTAANVIAGAAGPTVSLTLRYLRPTLINQPLVYEAEVTHIVGRRIHSKGRIVQNGIVTVEAEGEFVNLDPAAIEAMHRRNDAAGSEERDDPVKAVTALDQSGRVEST